MEQAQQFFTVEEASGLLKISPVTMYRRIAEGKISVFRSKGTSGDIRISKEALDEYIQTNSSQVAVEVK